MEMHQLRYFVAVAQTGSFSRAAERCHVSQPSLSQQIAKLEKRLGQRLLDRLGRKAVLTDAGRLLLDRAMAILAAADDVQRRLRDEIDWQGGQLAIGAIPTIAPYLLPVVLRQFARRFPRIEITVHEDVTQHLVQAIVAGELDLAVAALPLDDPHLQVEALFSEDLLLALPPRHRLIRRKEVTMEDLQDERFILLNEMHCLGDQILTVCRAGGCQPKIACRSAQIPTIQSLIGLGQGVSLLPQMARRADRGKALVYRLLSKNPPKRTVAVMWHRHRYHSPAEEAFLGELRTLAGSQTAST